jgi:peptidoglycan/LPS O-acetylase OafA/YrhL
MRYSSAMTPPAPATTAAILALPRLPRLDTFRAVAALAVVHTHYFEVAMPWPVSRIGFGSMAVVSFFVLSGFLITTVLLEDRDDRKSAVLKRFYIRRSFRIFPLYYFALVVGIALGVFGFRETVPWSAFYLMNFYVMLGGTEAGLAGHFWSLAIEEQFYLVWPLMVVLLGFRATLTAACALILGAVAYRFWVHSSGADPRLTFATIGSADALCIGALLALAYRRLSAATIEWTLRVTLPIGIASLALFSNDVVQLVHGSLLHAIHPAGACLFFAWLIARAVRDGPTASTWGGRWLPTLGVTSYGIYVYHHPMRAIADILDPDWTSWSLRIACVVATIAAAQASWRFLERPALRLGHSLAARVGSAGSRSSRLLAFAAIGSKNHQI